MLGKVKALTTDFYLRDIYRIMKEDNLKFYIKDDTLYFIDDVINWLKLEPEEKKA